METVTEKRIYISADYDPTSGDRDVVEELKRLAKDQRCNIEFKDMAAAKSGSVSDNEDCRACDLKEEFNRKINISSIVVFVVGDKTKTRDAGSTCELAEDIVFSSISALLPRRLLSKFIDNIEFDAIRCTPYKRNAIGSVCCKQTASDVRDIIHTDIYNDNKNKDVIYVNKFPYLQHEFKQAKRKKKKIVIFYNSSINQKQWLPSYMKGYESCAIPFWIDKENKVLDHLNIKKALEFDKDKVDSNSN